MLPGGVERPAVITSVPPTLDPNDVEQRVNLKIFLEPSDSNLPGTYRGTGTECWHGLVPYDGSEKPPAGTWHWPKVDSIATPGPRVQGLSTVGTDAQQQAAALEQEQIAKRNSAAVEGAAANSPA